MRAVAATVVEVTAAAAMVAVAMADMADMAVISTVATSAVDLAGAGVGAGLTTIAATMATTADGSACACGAAITGLIVACGAAGTDFLETKKERLAVGEPFAWCSSAELFPIAHVDKVSGNRGGGGHRRRHQMRAALVTLTALEIAV